MNDNRSCVSKEQHRLCLIDKTTGPFDAWKQECIVKPTSYGGAPGGVRIPYTVTFIGERTAGTVTMSDRVPTFTPASS